ncbi:MAG: hypothetical protein ACI4ET_05695, partial [Bilifractor sp.]
FSFSRIPWPGYADLRDLQYVLHKLRIALLLRACRYPVFAHRAPGVRNTCLCSWRFAFETPVCVRGGLIQ